MSYASTTTTLPEVAEFPEPRQQIFRNAHELRRDAAALLHRLYPDEDPGMFGALIDGMKRIRRLQLPELPGVKFGGFELESSPNGPQLAAAVGQWAKVLGDFVEKHFDNKPTTLLLDRLDDGWDASADSKMMLVGVLKAARDINIRLSKSSRPAPVIAFLRSDIFGELQFNDKNKMSADIETLAWTEDRLLQVASLRIAKSLSCDPSIAWRMIFSSSEMRQRASTHSYILKRTMGKPRDIIAFCIKCKEVAIEHRHDQIETSDIYEGERLYSQHVYNELDDEMHKQVPKSRQYFQTLRDIGKMRFDVREWTTVLQRRETDVTPEQARERLKTLFDYSVIGVQRIGGTGGGSRFDFNYDDRVLEPDFASAVTVHPALRLHLQLIEPRERAGGSSSGAGADAGETGGAGDTDGRGDAGAR